ncbi:MAG: RNB domain-containing ribonuclease [Bacilli bacterium]|nr:RNB domain-containing ribonuclease [Bacilli bacterium]
MSGMKHYLELALKKEKKAASFEKIVSRIEKLKSEELHSDVILTAEEKKELLELIREGVTQYEIYMTPNENYIAFSKTSFRKGRFYGNRDGRGKVSVTTSYVDRDGQLVVNNEKYEVHKENTNGAIDGDFVLIDIGGTQGIKVVKVLDRNLEYIPGEVYCIGSSYFVRPIDKKKQSITIALKGEAIEGQRVAVSLEEQTAPNFYTASIVRVFNHKDDPNEDILWEAFKLGVDNEFSNESLEQLEHIIDEVRDVDRIGREDRTQNETITLDGITTKDMDDAISCYKNERGNYVLEVDIIDISSLVPYGSPLDRDGFRKGNSYYPGGIVLPNYPRKIANQIGSLNQDKDRLTISDILEITPEGKVVNYRYVPTVTRSKLKMNYDTVNQILKGGDIPTEYQSYEQTLQVMRDLAKILHDKRMAAGAYEFNRPEPSGIYGPNGHMLDIGVRTQDVAENIIEEFMLIANVTRAKFFQKHGIPCLYRVHEAPNVDKLKKYLEMLDAIGLPFHGYDAEELASNHAAFQKLISHVSNCGRLSSFLLTELIKTQSRAKYSEVNVGHNGLAEDEYMQGTSPARRYGDKINQDISWDCVFRPDPGLVQRKKWISRLPEIAERVTHTEKVADDLEQEVFRMQFADMMSHHIGEECEATVIGLSNECMVVQFDNLAEATVRVWDLKGDYVYSEESYSLVSLDGEQNYYLGDRLRLCVKSASKETKKVDLTVIEKIHETQFRDSDAINQAVKIKTKEERTRRAFKKN